MQSSAQHVERTSTSANEIDRCVSEENDNAQGTVGPFCPNFVTVVFAVQNENLHSSSVDDETFKKKTLRQAQSCLEDIFRYAAAAEGSGSCLIESTDCLDLFLSFEVDMQRLCELIRLLKEREETDSPTTSIRSELNTLIRSRSKLKEIRNCNARKMLDFVRDEANLRNLIRFYRQMEDEKECIKVFWGVQKLMKLEMDKRWSSVVMYKSKSSLVFEILEVSGEYTVFKHQHDSVDDRVVQLVQIAQPRVDFDGARLYLREIEERYIFLDRKLEAVEILAGSDSLLMKALGKSL